MVESLAAGVLYALCGTECVNRWSIFYLSSLILLFQILRHSLWLWTEELPVSSTRILNIFLLLEEWFSKVHIRMNFFMVQTKLKIPYVIFNWILILLSRKFISENITYMCACVFKRKEMFDVKCDTNLCGNLSWIDNSGMNRENSWYSCNIFNVASGFVKLQNVEDCWSIWILNEMNRKLYFKIYKLSYTRLVTFEYSAISSSKIEFKTRVLILAKNENPTLKNDWTNKSQTNHKQMIINKWLRAIIVIRR